MDERLTTILAKTISKHDELIERLLKKYQKQALHNKTFQDDNSNLQKQLDSKVRLIQNLQNKHKLIKILKLNQDAKEALKSDELNSQEFLRNIVLLSENKPPKDLLNLIESRSEQAELLKETGSKKRQTEHLSAQCWDTAEYLNQAEEKNCNLAKHLTPMEKEKALLNSKITELTDDLHAQDKAFDACCYELGQVKQAHSGVESRLGQQKQHPERQRQPQDEIKQLTDQADQQVREVHEAREWLETRGTNLGDLIKSQYDTIPPRIPMDIVFCIALWLLMGLAQFVYQQL